MTLPGVQLCESTGVSLWPGTANVSLQMSSNRRTNRLSLGTNLLLDLDKFNSFCIQDTFCLTQWAESWHRISHHGTVTLSMHLRCFSNNVFWMCKDTRWRMCENIWIKWQHFYKRNVQLIDESRGNYSVQMCVQMCVVSVFSGGRRTQNCYSS